LQDLGRRRIVEVDFRLPSNARPRLDEAQLRFANAPLQFEDAFEDAKQRFIDVYEAMSAEKKQTLKREAIQVNMKEIWGDTARHDAYYPRRVGHYPTDHMAEYI